ncbi:MAG: tRNA (adenosine(37)-N6)-threonylcarbamoyltransferase complex ATPase subunit type 1 TsaE [Planctomycetes bacterium]|nr:tRNA (adenosine(37)-N6)-threonylcarbamoyltransferase complex ATPase subunit type 1 TsaE [Planctomycetota bacterium]
MTVVVTAAPRETELLGELLAERLAGGETLLLCGELGSGKTCLVRGLARGLGIDARLVKSPSYNVLCSYCGGRLLLDHFDAYFVREPEEFYRSGLLEFADAAHVIAVEWADRFPGCFDAGALNILLEHAGATRRRASMSGGGQRGAALSAGLAEAFAARRGRPQPPRGRRT